MAEKKEAQQQPIIKQKPPEDDIHKRAYESIAPVVVDPATRWTIG